MRIKLDANISKRIAAALRSLERDQAIQLGSVAEDYEEGISDPDWMFRFREQGGIAMISGDHNILQDPVNLIAYTESGLISIWPPSGYPKLKLFGQAAFWIRWWPAIKLRLQQSEAGSRWRIPLSWTASPDSFEPIQDPRIDKPK